MAAHDGKQRNDGEEPVVSTMGHIQQMHKGSDGLWFIITMGRQPMFHRWCKDVIGRPDLLDTPGAKKYPGNSTAERALFLNTAREVCVIASDPRNQLQLFTQVQVHSQGFRPAACCLVIKLCDSLPGTLGSPCFFRWSAAFDLKFGVDDRGHRQQKKKRKLPRVPGRLPQSLGTCRQAAGVSRESFRRFAAICRNPRGQTSAR